MITYHCLQARALHDLIRIKQSYYRKIYKSHNSK